MFSWRKPLQIPKHKRQLQLNTRDSVCTDRVSPDALAAQDAKDQPSEIVLYGRASLAAPTTTPPLQNAEGVMTTLVP